MNKLFKVFLSVLGAMDIVMYIITPVLLVGLQVQGLFHFSIENPYIVKIVKDIVNPFIESSHGEKSVLGCEEGSDHIIIP